MILMTSERFHALAEALLSVKPDWFADKPDVDAIKLILGEVGDIWPASILDEVAGDESASPARNDITGHFTDAELDEMFDGVFDHMAGHRRQE